MSHTFPSPSVSLELDLGPAGGEGLVFLAAGAGGPGERRADGSGAQDDGAAINSSRRLPHPAPPPFPRLSTPHPSLAPVALCSSEGCSQVHPCLPSVLSASVQGPSSPSATLSLCSYLSLFLFSFPYLFLPSPPFQTHAPVLFSAHSLLVFLTIFPHSFPQVC